jgi:integrase
MDIYNISNLIDNEISPKTMKTYINILNKLLSNLRIKNKNITYNFFLQNYGKIIKYIKENIKNLGSQNTYISSILNILKKNQLDNNKLIETKYRELLNENREIINKNKLNNEKNEKENKNWLSYEELINKYNELENKYIQYLYNPKKLDKQLFNKIQNYIILSFYILIEPRRLEYTTLKYQNYDILNDNYINFNNNTIVLNNYKTSKYNKDFNIDLNNNKLLDLINKFIQLKNKNNIISDYLFTSINNNPLDNTQITKRLNSIFDKNISVSMIRKIYLTHNYGNNIDTFKNIIKTSKNMGNSVNVITNNYLKK